MSLQRYKVSKIGIFSPIYNKQNTHNANYRPKRSLSRNTQRKNKQIDENEEITDKTRIKGSNINVK